MDLGDFHRAASHDSSYSTVARQICRTHNRVLQLPLRLQQAPTSQTFHTERLPRRPIAQRWSTIINPFSDFILKDFPGGPSRGASQLILCFHHPLRSQLCFGQANVSLNRVSHKRVSLFLIVSIRFHQFSAKKSIFKCLRALPRHFEPILCGSFFSLCSAPDFSGVFHPKERPEETDLGGQRASSSGDPADRTEVDEGGVSLIDSCHQRHKKNTN